PAWRRLEGSRKVESADGQTSRMIAWRGVCTKSLRPRFFDTGAARVSVASCGEAGSGACGPIQA
ncbi:MAG: hypothetical protein OXI73_16540, partial [Rhodospirillales bacterium]|nr:hypothetical protein [Rhodospirillales bacterium]